MAFSSVFQYTSGTYALDEDCKLVFINNGSLFDLIRMDEGIALKYIETFMVYKDTNELLVRYNMKAGTNILYLLNGDDIKVVLASLAPLTTKIALLKKLNFDKIPFNPSDKHLSHNGELYNTQEQRLVDFDPAIIPTLSNDELVSLIRSKYDCFTIIDNMTKEQYLTMRSSSDYFVKYAINSAIPGKFFDIETATIDHYYRSLSVDQQKQLIRKFGGYRRWEHYIEDIDAFLGDYTVFSDLPLINSRGFVERIVETRGIDAFWSIIQYIEPENRRQLVLKYVK